jgi:hypothetical protein
MRALVLAALLMVSSGLADAQKSVRQIDFKNFTYPLSGRTLGHDRFEWLDTSSARHISLVNGKDAPKSPGFTLDSVQFSDVTGEGMEDAVVVLHFNPGGTQQTDYVYVYSFAAEKAKLLAYFHSGDRGYSGLYKVYGESGKLVVELFDPKKRSGDCCSSGFVRTRYKWHVGRFETFGARERVTLQKP